MNISVILSIIVSVIGFGIAIFYIFKAVLITKKDAEDKIHKSKARLDNDDNYKSAHHKSSSLVS